MKHLTIFETFSRTYIDELKDLAKTLILTAIDNYSESSPYIKAELHEINSTYNEIQEFVDEYMFLTLNITSNTDIKGRAEYDSSASVITVKILNELKFISTIDSKLNQCVKYTAHELQHAYDYWKSKGEMHQLDDEKSELINKAATIASNKPDRNYTDEEIDVLIKASKYYINIPTELNAHFIETLITLTDSNLSWNEFFDEFKKRFTRWDMLSVANNKKLVKRLYKFYDNELNTD